MPIPEMVKTPLTHMQFLKWQVYQYNHLEKQNKDGYECTACKNRRFFALINSEGDFALRPCTCNGIIERQRKASQEQEQNDKRKRR